MDADHDPDSVTPPTEEQCAQQLEPWVRMRQAVRELAESVRDLPAGTPPVLIPQLRIPRLELTYVDDGPANPVDPRHVIVSVLTVRSQRHDFSDDGGLVWQTYGAAHGDFSTERLLEIQNTDGEVIASYPAGTWLDVCYPAYRRPGELKDQP